MVKATGVEPEQTTPRKGSNSVYALKKIPSDVGRLQKDVPSYVREPPIEAVVFGWGVAEDGQLVRSLGIDFVQRTAFMAYGLFSKRIRAGNSAQGFLFNAVVAMPQILSEIVLGYTLSKMTLHHHELTSCCSVLLCTTVGK